MCLFLCHNLGILHQILLWNLRIGAKFSGHQISPFQISHIPNFHHLGTKPSKKILLLRFLCKIWFEKVLKVIINPCHSRVDALVEFHAPISIHERPPTGQKARVVLLKQTDVHHHVLTAQISVYLRLRETTTSRLAHGKQLASKGSTASVPLMALLLSSGKMTTRWAIVVPIARCHLFLMVEEKHGKTFGVFLLVSSVHLEYDVLGDRRIALQDSQINT